MSLDRVPGVAGTLYIGAAISMRRYEALKKANIKRVVSVMRPPLDKDLYVNYEHLVVEVDDMEDENIIEHFATTNQFISKGVAENAGVLCHCAMGKSRSATIVIAYMLSQSPTTTLNEAVARLQEARPIAEPNAGFMSQLELYYRMGCPEDIDSHPMYQRWLFQREVEDSLACGRPPDTIRFEDEAHAAEAANQHNATTLDVRCRRCRRSLATSKYLVEHEPHQSSGPRPDGDASVGSFPPIKPGKPATAASTACAHVFVDPLSWMRQELEQGELNGKLECPSERCRSVVGKYAWQGMRCSCGGWVVPAFSLAKNRVDEVKLRANVAMSGKI